MLPEDQGSLIQIPRRQLSEHFHTEQLKQDLQDNGLELAWVGVGTWEVRDDQFPSAPGDTGPAKTLMATWRDLQRANLYNSADYQAREHDRCLGERTAQGIQELIPGASIDIMQLDLASQQSVLALQKHSKPGITG